MSKKQWFASQAAGVRRKHGHVPPLRLSQCMIVKNEEKNIERALAWGKKVVYEQVVVDTGSADRTVELAERMGARVFHFDWIDDFSAAKNFAISKAKGNWVVFLDADEYFNDGDALKLMGILAQLNPYAECTSVVMPIANLRDDGQVESVLTQERVFRTNALKYVGAIHEYLAPVKESVKYRPFVTNDITVMHTGYTKSAYTETNKLDRNIEMLRRELESKPDDPNAMAYLADSLLVRGGSYEYFEEAKRLYIESLLGDKPMFAGVKANAYPKLLNISQNSDPDLYYRAAERAVKDFPSFGTFNLHYGAALYSRGDYPGAWKYLRKAEDFLKNGNMMEIQDMKNLTSMLFGHLAMCADAMGDKRASVKYSVLTLREDKRQVGVLGPLIVKLWQNGVGEDEILNFLGKIYNLSDPREVITVAKGAEAAGSEYLMNRLKDMAETLLETPA